jgi:hypothetical protein
VTVSTCVRPYDRARGGHDLLIRRLPWGHPGPYGSVSWPRARLFRLSTLVRGDRWLFIRVAPSVAPSVGSTPGLRRVLTAEARIGPLWWPGAFCWRISVQRLELPEPY